jgi:hypothetical protein
MRIAAALACILLPLAAQCALAQAPQPLYELDGRLDAPTMTPPATTRLHLEASRLCPAQALVLAEGHGTLRVQGPEGVTVTGPMAVDFPQQVCAQEPRHVVSVELDVTAAASAPSGLGSVRVDLDLPAASPIDSPGHADASIGITIVGSQGTMTTQGGDGGANPIPAPSMLLALGAVLALAASRRRA